MKKKYYLLSILIYNFCCLYSQQKNELSDFQMSNNTSPAFQLLEETVTDIYTPENLKALAFHIQNNLGESIAIEISPYFYINPKSKNKTYYRYMGIIEDNDGNIHQKPFSGINTTTLSFAYLKKDFESIYGDKQNKTFSIAARTTILRFFNKNKIVSNAKDAEKVLEEINSLPEYILEMENKEEQNQAIKNFYNNLNIEETLKPFLKTIKPIFKLDGSIAYSSLFRDSSVNSETLKRFGSWLTGEFSMILNEDDDESPTNNYANFLFIARYVEDGFNIDEIGNYSTSIYRDFGAKIDFDFGKFTFGYEYIKRHGTIKSERSVGNISFALDKSITINGGFGKDFQIDNNLLALFGINWGLNFGN